MQIELRPDEQMLREKELNTNTRVDLEMAGIPYRLGHVGAYGSPYARILRKGEARSGAADSSL